MTLFYITVGIVSIMLVGTICWSLIHFNDDDTNL